MSHKKEKVGKPMMHLVDPYFLEDMAKVLSDVVENGKYKAGNWRECKDMTMYIDAMLRHSNAINKGEYIDEDSGLPHAAHVACNAMVIHYMTNIRLLDKSKIVKHDKEREVSTIEKIALAVAYIAITVMAFMWPNHEPHPPMIPYALDTVGYETGEDCYGRSECVPLTEIIYRETNVHYGRVLDSMVTPRSYYSIRGWRGYDEGEIYDTIPIDPRTGHYYLHYLTH